MTGADAKRFEVLQPIFLYPLPFPWAASRSKDQQVYFYHRGLKKSRWDHPMQQLFSDLCNAVPDVSDLRRVEASLRDLVGRLRSRRTVQRDIGVWSGPIENGDKPYWVRADGGEAGQRINNPRVAAASHICLQLAMVEEVWGRALPGRPFELSLAEVVREA